MMAAGEHHSTVFVFAGNMHSHAPHTRARSCPSSRRAAAARVREPAAGRAVQRLRADGRRALPLCVSLRCPSFMCLFCASCTLGQSVMSHLQWFARGGLAAVGVCCARSPAVVGSGTAWPRHAGIKVGPADAAWLASHSLHA